MSLPYKSENQPRKSGKQKEHRKTPINGLKEEEEEKNKKAWE